jgi:hypothetical protein
MTQAVSAAISASPPIPSSAPAAAAATTSATSTAARAKPKQKITTTLRSRTVEPSKQQLQRAGLTTKSTTDLILTIQYAPMSGGSMKRRVYFPNHVTANKEMCIAIGNQLQDDKGLQIRPPRIPSFLLPTLMMIADQSTSSAAIDQLIRIVEPNSRQHHYLQQMQLTTESGDSFDLLQHSFTDAECVANWSCLLTPSTRAYHPTPSSIVNGGVQKIPIRLSFANSLIMEAARCALVAHTDLIESEKQARTRASSPSPSVASTVSISSPSLSLTDIRNSPPSSPSLSPSASLSVSGSPCTPNRRRLTTCAINSFVTVSEFEERFLCTTVTGWPRENPTELCGGNDQLTAFLQLKAPHLHLLTHQEHGTTSPSTLVICQQQHLAELSRLQGQSSPEHGISRPLNLNAAVHLMGAYTCTFCWSPGHGAARCPHHTKSSAAATGNPPIPTASQPACRHCYSFDHHSAACRNSASIVCKLCEQTGHSTHACQHFKPYKQPLKDFLRATTSPSSTSTSTTATNRQTSTSIPAPVLSAAQSSATRPWQAPLNPPNPIVEQQQVPIPTSFITSEQLTSALTPIFAMLMQISQHMNLPAIPAAIIPRVGGLPPSPCPVGDRQSL